MKKTLAIALLVFSAGAGAQTLYRCGNTYSEQACANAASVVQGVHAPTLAEQAAARKETDREMKVAEAMEKARVKEEAKPVAAYIPKEKEQKIEEHKPEVFAARVPGPKKKVAKKKNAG